MLTLTLCLLGSALAGMAMAQGSWAAGLVGLVVFWLFAQATLVKAEESSSSQKNLFF